MGFEGEAGAGLGLVDFGDEDEDGVDVEEVGGETECVAEESGKIHGLKNTNSKIIK